MIFGRREGKHWHIYKGVDRPNKFYDHQVVVKYPQRYEEGYVYRIDDEDIYLIRKKGSTEFESIQE